MNTWHLTKIPKILHVYYGGGAISYLRYLTVLTFSRLNPDWVIKFYYPKKPHINKSWVSFEQKYDFKGEDYFEQITKINRVEVKAISFSSIGVSDDISEVYKSDFLRWYLLYTEGGLWSDMDIIYFKPMTSLSFNTKENSLLDTGVCISSYGHSIGFMFASANNAYYKYLWDRAKQAWNGDNYQSIGSILSNTHFPDIESINKKLPKLHPINIPMDVVYAYNASDINDIYHSTSMQKYTNASIGLHWYAGHTFAGEFLNKTKGGEIPCKTCVLGKTIAAIRSESMPEILWRYTDHNSKILDLGCGDKEILNHLRGTKTTLDAWPKFNPDVLWDMNKLPLPFNDNSFDCILMLDVIEHLSKENGLKLLEDVKRITSNNIILLTPLWWTPNLDHMHDSSSLYYLNSFEKHRSLWSVEDFEDWDRIEDIDFIGNYYVGVWNKGKHATKT